MKSKGIMVIAIILLVFAALYGVHLATKPDSGSQNTETGSQLNNSPLNSRPMNRKSPMKRESLGGAARLPQSAQGERGEITQLIQNAANELQEYSPPRPNPDERRQQMQEIASIEDEEEYQAARMALIESRREKARDFEQNLTPEQRERRAQLQAVQELATMERMSLRWFSDENIQPQAKEYRQTILNLIKNSDSLSSDELKRKMDELKTTQQILAKKFRENRGAMR